MFPRSITIGVACVFAAARAGGAADVRVDTPTNLPPELTCSLTYERATAVGRAAHATYPMNVFTDYGDGDAAKLLVAINAYPPATEYPAERVLVIEMPDDDFVTVALVHDGCAKHRLSATTEAWSKLRRGALGDAL